MRALNACRAGVILSPILLVALLVSVYEKPFAENPANDVANDAMPESETDIAGAPVIEAQLAPARIWSEPGTESFAQRLAKLRNGSLAPDGTDQASDLPERSSGLSTDSTEDEDVEVEYVPPSERLPIEKITYVGNHFFGDGLLASITELKAGSGFFVLDNREAARKITKAYHLRNFTHAQVELLKGNSADDREVVFRIDEGPRVEVSNIRFLGNQQIPTWVLRLQVKGVPVFAFQPLNEALFPFVDTALRPSAATLTNWQALSRCYQDRGFLDVKVTSRIVTTADPSLVEVEYVIDERERFKIRVIELDGSEIIAGMQLRDVLKVRSNDTYDLRVINSDRERIEERCRELGLDSVDVTIKMKRVWADYGRVDLVFDVRERHAGEIALTGAEDFPVEIGPSAAKIEDCVAGAGSTGSSGDWRELCDIDRFIFTGVKTFDVADIRQALNVDFDLILAAHPASDSAGFYRELERAIRNGYLYRGFADATVDVLLNTTRRQVEVRVHEGERCRCAQVQIAGTSHVPTETMLEKLSKISWTSDFQWKEGEFAPFDDYTVTELRQRVEWVFGEMGYLHPDFDIRVEREPETNTAVLRIDIKNDGPRAIVGEIQVTGTNRDSAAEVVKYLECRTGNPYDPGLAKRLKQRLRESGRFMGIEVSANERPATAAGDEQLVDLKIHLQEYDKAPPLAQDLPPAERALLKLQEWVTRWAAGETDDDVIIERTTAPEATADPRHPRPSNIRMVISPERGQIISFGTPARGDNGPMFDTLIVMSPDRLTLAAPHRNAKLVIPVSGDQRFKLSLIGDAEKPKRNADGLYRFWYRMGLNSKHDKTPDNSPLGVTVDISPTFLMTLAHFEKTKCELDQGVCRIENNLLEVRIDEATGKLIEYRLKLGDAGELSIRAESRALESELRKIDEMLAACTASYDATAPGKSAFEFFTDELLAVAEMSGSSEEASAALRALQKLARLWSPPGVDELFAFDSPRFPKPADVFEIPGFCESWRWDGDLHWWTAARKNMTAWGELPAYRRLVPKTGWMWPMGRDALLTWASMDDVPASSLRNAPFSADIGPIGELFAGLLEFYLNGSFSETARREGLKRMTAEAFANDYRPLLSDESWLGRWVLSLARALRQLDESELQALVLLLPDAFPREMIANSLVMLKANPDKPVEEVLPAVLDHFWEASLRRGVKAALTSFATPPKAQPRPAQHDDQVRPANAEVE